MENQLANAIRLAAKVHKGQTDRLGKPYILHVMRVMMRGHDLEEQVLGALHDVLERSDLTLADLAKKGYPDRILRALDHISRRKEEDYAGYIDRVMNDPLAVRVKVHDLADKMDLKHVESLEPNDVKRYNRQLAAYHKLKKEVEAARSRMTIKGKA
ncbi:MAG: phosphohydrolase [Flavobacteriales bacterium]|nr:phosphohydrolase [Flavobacteriales bacterium]